MQFSPHTFGQQSVSDYCCSGADTENKATRIKIWGFGRPHMRAFHLSWMAFFTTFVSTFGPAALITIIRDDVNMTKTDIGNANIAAVCGAVLGRVAMGNFVDTYGKQLFVAAHLHALRC